MRPRIPFSDQRDSSVVCIWFYLVFDGLAATTIAAATWTLSGGAMTMDDAKLASKPFSQIGLALCRFLRANNGIIAS